jgi:hypothetical protein
LLVCFLPTGLKQYIEFRFRFSLERSNLSLTVILFVFALFCYVAMVGLKVLDSNNLPASVSQVAGTTGVHTTPNTNSDFKYLKGIFMQMSQYCSKVEKSNGIILLPLDSDLNVFYGFLI